MQIDSKGTQPDIEDAESSTDLYGCDSQFLEEYFGSADLE